MNVLGVRFASLQPPKQASVRTLWSLCLGVTLLSLVLYLPTLDHSYFADDHIYLGFASSKLVGLKPSEVFRIFFDLMNPWEYLPLRDLSYWIDIQLLGGFPDGFHFSNLVWYAASCLTAGWFTRELLYWVDPGVNVDIAGAATALALAIFAVHPAHVEPVAWIAGRKDLMAGTFMLLALSAQVRGVRNACGMRWLTASCLGVLAALLSKGASVGVVLLFPFLALGALRGAVASDRWRCWSYAILPLLIAITVSMVHARIGATTGIQADNSVDGMVLLDRASRIWVTLLGILAWPIDLRLIYDVFALSSLHWLVSGVSLVGTVLACYSILMGRRSLLAVALLVMLFAVLPYLQFVPFSTWSMASERFVFVPVLGLSLLAVEGLRRSNGHGLYIYAISIAVLVLSAVGFVVQNDRVREWEFPRGLVRSQYVATADYFGGVRLYLQIAYPRDLSYGEAIAIAGRIDREDARSLLLAWIDVRDAYYSNIAEGRPGWMTDTSRFCTLAPALRQRLVGERGSAARDADLAYTSMLRGIERDMAVTLPDINRVCRERREESPG